MSKLSDDLPPPYESHHQSQDNILITVIQNERRLREWAPKMAELEPRFHRFFDRPFGGGARCPNKFEYIRQGIPLLDEMTDLYKEITNTIEERGKSITQPERAL